MCVRCLSVVGRGQMGGAPKSRERREEGKFKKVTGTCILVPRSMATGRERETDGRSCATYKKSEYVEYLCWSFAV